MLVAKLHRRWLIWPVVLAVFCTLTPFAFADGDVMVEGFSQPYRTAEVAAATAGILEPWLVVEGQDIKTGQVLVRLDSSVHEVMLKIAEQAMRSEGELASAEAEHTLRQQRLEAIRGLASRQHASQDELRWALTEADLAAANLRTAHENQLLRQLEHQKLTAQAASYEVRAPFDGVVTTFHRQAGEYVGPVDPVVCTVAELTTLSVNFFVPREQRDRVVVGAQASVWFTDTQREATGAVYFVSPFPDGETNTYQVKIRVDNSNLSLTAGERCRLTLRSERPETISSGTGHESDLTRTLPTPPNDVSAPADWSASAVRTPFGMRTNSDVP